MSAPPSGSHVRASQPGSGLLRGVGSLGEGGVGWRQEPVEEEARPLLPLQTPCLCIPKPHPSLAKPRCMHFGEL